MIRRIAMAVALAATFASFSACRSATQEWKADPTANFFPLSPNAVWTYKIDSKSQRANYVVTDRVVGSQYVPALKLTGLVVEEFYNLDRAGLRPIVYQDTDGYITRLSGLDYAANQIKAPAWGRSEEKNFIPEHLTPNLAWKNILFPYGKLPGSFDITQAHQSFMEPAEVVVPAGHFRNCIRIETLAHYEGGEYATQKQNLTLTYEDWYAPNVGLVRTVAYQGGADGPEMERVELMRFESGTPASAQGAQPPTAPPTSTAPQTHS
ncbi:MAG TPA: hypothetical protein VGG60_15870 [Candidatus Binataceae bacterium]|jgi:hypothetical protein